jgi:hypothetical protein
MEKEDNLISINLDDFNDLKVLLIGAAIVIQTAWRRFKLKIKSNKDKYFNILTSSIDNQKCYLKNFKSYCYNNNFLSDVIIYVDDRIYYCHSFVLWCNSQYFRNIFQENDFNSNLVNSSNNNNNLIEIDDINSFENDRFYHKFRYEFKILINHKYWELILRFIYGYDIYIEPKQTQHLYDLSKMLQINELRKALSPLLYNVDRTPKTTTQSFKGNSSYYFIQSEQSNIELINHYRFFECVLNYYENDRLCCIKTKYYLSSQYIDYWQMSANQLLKCLNLLKEKLCKKFDGIESIVKYIKIIYNEKKRIKNEILI